MDKEPVIFEIATRSAQTFIPENVPYSASAWQSAAAQPATGDPTKSCAHFEFFAGPVPAYAEGLGELIPTPAYTEGIYAVKLSSESGVRTVQANITFRYESEGHSVESWLRFTDSESGDLPLQPSDVDVSQQGVDFYPDIWQKESYSVSLNVGEIYLVHGYATQKHWSTIGHWSMLDISVSEVAPEPPTGLRINP